MPTFAHIPLWVFVILAALIAMGLRQTRTRHMYTRRLMTISLMLTLLTLVGVLQLWQHTPWLTTGVLTWAACTLLVTAALGQGPAPAGARYDHVNHRFTVPGSGLPLVLYLSIFVCKFLVGMVRATQPEVLNNLHAALFISALYGLLSGLLNARTWRLWKLKVKP